MAAGTTNGVTGAGVLEVHYDGDKELRVEEAEMSRSS